MQKISEILNSPTAPAETGARASSRPTTSDAGNWIWSNDERLAGRPGVPEPVPCEFCGALRYHKGILLGNRILWPPYGAERCTCPEAVAAYEKAKAEREAAEAAAAKAEEEKKMRDRIKRIVGESGMGDRFLRRTFSTFQLTDDNKRAAAAARRYAEGFDAMLPQPGRQEPGRNGLFIAGPPGTGKTHLAAAIANHLIAQGKPVICMTMIDLLERIKRTYTEIGRLYYENYRDTADAFLAELCQQVTDANARVAELEAQMDELRAAAKEYRPAPDLHTVDAEVVEPEDIEVEVTEEPAPEE